MAFFTPDQIAILQGIRVRVDLLAEFQFQSETVNVWNGNSMLEHDNKTWLPLYGAATIDGLGISGGTQSEKVDFTLNGLPNQPADFLRLALQETPDVMQQLVIVFMQLFDDDWQPHGPPISIFWGFMQPPRINRTPQQDTEGSIQSVQLTAENAFFNRSRPAYGRYSDRDQQTRSPGDKFFQFVPSLLHKTVAYPDF
jgi:hypothetical protein